MLGANHHVLGCYSNVNKSDRNSATSQSSQIQSTHRPENNLFQFLPTACFLWLENDEFIRAWPISSVQLTSALSCLAFSPDLGLCTAWFGACRNGCERIPPWPSKYCDSPLRFELSRGTNATESEPIHYLTCSRPTPTTAGATLLYPQHCKLLHFPSCSAKPASYSFVAVLEIHTLA